MAHPTRTPGPCYRLRKNPNPSLAHGEPPAHTGPGTPPPGEAGSLPCRQGKVVARVRTPGQIPRSPQASLNFVDLSFLICKMGTLKEVVWKTLGLIPHNLQFCRRETSALCSEVSSSGGEAGGGGPGCAGGWFPTVRLPTSVRVTRLLVRKPGSSIRTLRTCDFLPFFPGLRRFVSPLWLAPPLPDRGGAHRRL